MQKDEKRLLLQQYLTHHPQTKFRNDHERDATACALYAYKKVKTKIDKINNFLNENQDTSNHISATEFSKIALEYDISFESILSIAKKQNEHHAHHQHKDEDQIKFKPNTHLSSEDAKKLIARNELLKNQIQNLNAKIEFQDRLLKTLQQEKQKENKHKISQTSHKITLTPEQNRIEHIVDKRTHQKEDRIIQLTKQKDTLCESLQKLNNQNQHLINFIRELPTHTLIICIDNLTKAHIEPKLARHFIRENDYLYVQTPAEFSEDILSQLAKFNITLLSTTKIPEKVRTILSTTKIQESDVKRRIGQVAMINTALLKGKLQEKDILERVLKFHKER